jgi:alanine-glyoxylate transaminase/serine-glyoxylate transaminase/serine-pyruvate transaminase
MTNSPIEAINVEPRLLCGPGPANISPDVLSALSKPLLGHLDPDMYEILTELAAMTARVYQRDEGDGVTLPISATGTSGMEAGIAALVEPGSTVIIGVNGYFGRRLVEIASRYHANVVEVEADWGQAVTNEALLEALAANPDARLMAVVHAETSSGVRHDLAELGAAMKGNDTFLMADCVTSLGGIEVALSDWGVDYAYSCSQKCLAMSPGMSPISISQRAVDFMRSQPKPNTFYLDPQLLEAYWLTRPPAYHHTLPSPLVFGLHEALREVLNEGSRLAGLATLRPVATCRLRWLSATWNCSPTLPTSCRSSLRCSSLKGSTEPASRSRCCASMGLRSAAACRARLRCGASA